MNKTIQDIYDAVIDVLPRPMPNTDATTLDGILRDHAIRIDGYNEGCAAAIRAVTKIFEDKYGLRATGADRTSPKANQDK